MSIQGKNKVLIIDDDQMVCKVLSLTLKRSGMNVLTSTSPKAGLDIVRSQPLDIVISDVRMPEMSGLDLLQILRGEGIVTPFVIISAQSSRDILLASLRIGAFDLINKPLQASIISRLMDEAIRVSMRQKEITLLKSQGQELTAHDQAIAWTLANVAPVAALDQGRLDQKTLEALSEKDPVARTLAAAILALQSARSAVDNLRNFQGRSWDLGVLIRLFHGLRVSFETLPDQRLVEPLTVFETCFAWLRVRPEDLAGDLATTVGLATEQLGKTLKALREGRDAGPELTLLSQHLAALDGRIQKSQQRAAS